MDRLRADPTDDGGRLLCFRIGKVIAMSIASQFRTFTARLITNRGMGPRKLRIRAWAWLCANTKDPDEKCCYLDAILGLDPSLEWVQMALAGIRQRHAGEHEHA